MKILCFGAGAIGSYIGGSLALIGNPLVYIEKPEYIDSLLKNGIRIRDDAGKELHLKRFEAYGSADEAFARHDDFDLIIPAVKSFNTDEVISALKPYAGRIPPILSLQNGVENEAKYAAVFGEDKVIPCSVCTAVSRGDLGVIQAETHRGLAIANVHPICAELQQECLEAGLNCKLMDDGPAMKWSKMISNLLSNAASAIFDMTPAEVYADKAGCHLEVVQIRETLKVMDALGISPVDIPGIPVKALCFAMKILPEFVLRPLLSKFIGGGRGAKMPSFYIDLHAGRTQSEVEFLNGAIVRRADEQGIPVPVNRAYYETLTALAAGTLPLDTYRKAPERFEQEKIRN